MSSEPARRAVVVVAAVAAVLATGCSMSPDEDSPTVAYREAEDARSLEVPPDLVKPSSSQALALGGTDGGSALLPEFEGIRFVRAGASAWLELEGVAPETVWPRVRGFLRGQGLTVERAEPDLGIIETGWAERYDSPSGGGLTGLLGGLFGGFGADSVRDRYQVRLERMDDDAGTRLFLVHRAAQEVPGGRNSNSDPNPREAGGYTWARLGGDPAIEAEMTRRLLVHLGVSEGRARGIMDDVDTRGLAVRYVETEAGVARLIIVGGDYRRVFARIGDALARIGADVEVAERERGRYRVRWTPPPEVAEETSGGFLGLFGGGEPEPQALELHMRLRAGQVRVVATDADGTRRSGPVQKALLRRLAEAMDGEVVVEEGEEEEPVSRDRGASGATRP